MDASVYLKKLKQYNSLLIVGYYPPPLGGISVHIYRLHKQLPNSRVLDTGKEESFKGQKALRLFIDLLMGKYQAVHIHVYDIKILLVVWIARFLKKFDIVFTAHNPRLFQVNNNYLKKFYRLFLAKVDYLIAVSDHIIEDYRENGVDLPENIYIKNAFISPPMEEEESILESYPESLNDFIDSHSPILTANASSIIMIGEVDLYGLDMCIQLTNKLKNDFPNIGFVFALADEQRSINYINSMKELIEKLGIENNFYFLTGQKELWPLFKQSNLMVRPTYSDGYGISIAEALYFSSPAIASAVCNRPEGTILFKNRDIDDLYEKSLLILRKEVA